MSESGRKSSTGIGRIRLFVLVEAVVFLVAASVHFGALGTHLRHFRAGAAESVIAVVLLVGLFATLLRDSWTRITGLLVQGFALLGTLVGIATVAIGVGPRTTPDIVYHLVITAVLVWGLIVAVRTKSPVRY